MKHSHPKNLKISPNQKHSHKPLINYKTSKSVTPRLSTTTQSSYSKHPAAPSPRSDAPCSFSAFPRFLYHLRSINRPRRSCYRSRIFYWNIQPSKRTAQYYTGESATVLRTFCQPTTQRPWRSLSSRRYRYARYLLHSYVRLPKRHSLYRLQHHHPQPTTLTYNDNGELHTISVEGTPQTQYAYDHAGRLLP